MSATETKKTKKKKRKKKLNVSVDVGFGPSGGWSAHAGAVFVADDPVGTLKTCRQLLESAHPTRKALNSACAWCPVMCVATSYSHSCLSDKHTMQCLMKLNIHLLKEPGEQEVGAMVSMVEKRAFHKHLDGLAQGEKLRAELDAVAKRLRQELDSSAKQPSSQTATPLSPHQVLTPWAPVGGIRRGSCWKCGSAACVVFKESEQDASLCSCGHEVACHQDLGFMDTHIAPMKEGDLTILLDKALGEGTLPETAYGPACALNKSRGGL